MNTNPYVTKITFQNNKTQAVLHYSDGDTVCVPYEDYARALMTLVKSKKEEIIRDFAM